MDVSGSKQGAGGVGGLLALSIHGGDHEGDYYPTYDGNGNIVEYIDDEGGVAAHYDYDPFGNNITPENDEGDLHDIFTYRFSTKPHDPITGHYYYGYRYYEPLTGRWLNRDPIEEEGGVNLYAFVRNNGVGRVDLLGLQKVWLPKKVNARGFEEHDSKGRGFADPVLVGISAIVEDYGVGVYAVTQRKGIFTGWITKPLERTAAVAFECDENGNISGESDVASGARRGKNVKAKIEVKTDGKTARVAFAAGASFEGSIEIEGSYLGLKVKFTSPLFGIERARTGTWECRCFIRDDSGNLTPMPDYE